MAKGNQAKENITQKILQTFDGSFVCAEEKSIRIPMMEDGVQVQIKVSLTCAKTNIDPNGGDILTPVNDSNEINFEDAPKAAAAVKPTEDEKQNVANLLAALGL